ncbi:MAG: proline dehydrogenase family protein [Candidatus Eremiobacteraeota bacterium]|nr:proline dehydrogenase family protein [Candidatus Eremiobacteraeota bacterium]
MTASLDYLGEDVLERGAALQTVETYFRILDALGESGVDSNVSLKLTAMGLLIDEGFALENLLRVLDRAGKNADPFVRIDMEGSAVTEATLRLFERAFQTHPNVGIVLQAYLKRTATDVERAIALGARVRLCKGAYSESPEIAYQSMPQIRANFMELAQALLERGHYPAIATHDRRLIARVAELTTNAHIGTDRFEYQMLLGCRPQKQRELVAQGYRLRIYVPFGTHWAGYFYRRVLERRENAWFALSSMFSR